MDDGQALESPRVAVVIPSYNSAQFLAATLGSVSAQTFRAFEVVLVDDGSTDETETLWRSLPEASDPRFRYVRQDNAGVAVARNTGIAATSAPYVAFLDADDWWEADRLQAGVDLLDRQSSVDVAHGWCSLMDVEGRPLDRLLTTDLEGDCLEELIRKNRIYLLSTLVRRSALDRANGFRTGLSGVEDWDLWLRMASSGSRFGCINRSLARYRQVPTSLSRNLPQMDQRSMRVVDEALDRAGDTFKHLRGPAVASISIELGSKALQASPPDFRFAASRLWRAVRVHPKTALRPLWLIQAGQLLLMPVLGAKRMRLLKSRAAHLSARVRRRTA
jgi:hypothetical protein